MRQTWTHAEDASGRPPIAKFVTPVTAGPTGTCFLNPMRQETGVGIMTRKIKLDRYDLVIAAAVALFALVAVSLMLTS